MDKYALSEEETAVFAAIRTAMLSVPTESQYKILRNMAHDMDREVVRPGATRAAAAAAGSTARARVDGTGRGRLGKIPNRATSSGRQGYPDAFVNGVGKPFVAAQAAAKAELGSPPTEGQKAALRAASTALRESFRRFNEATSASES
jgi:hypothetical protein